MAFQIRATAFLRSANLLTAVLPGMLFQMSTNRLSGQSADTLARAAWESKVVAVESPACAASAAVANAVMLLSSLIVNVATAVSPCPRAVCCGGHIHRSGLRNKQVNSD